MDSEQAQDPRSPRQGHGKWSNYLLTHRGLSIPIYFRTFFIMMFLRCFRAGNTRDMNRSLSFTGLPLLYVNILFLLKISHSCESWLLSETCYCGCILYFLFTHMKCCVWWWIDF